MKLPRSPFLLACAGAALLCPSVQATPSQFLAQTQLEASEAAVIDPIALMKPEAIAEVAPSETNAPVEPIEEPIEAEPATGEASTAVDSTDPSNASDVSDLSDIPNTTNSTDATVEPDSALEVVPEVEPEDSPEVTSEDAQVAPEIEPEDSSEEIVAPSEESDVEAESKPELETGEAPPNPDADAADAEAIAPPPAADAEPSTTLATEDRQQLLIEADRLYLQGRYEEAEFLYRKAKLPFVAEAVRDRPAAISDPTLLAPAGQVYWREAQAGREADLYTRLMVPLELLVEEYPEFIPGHLLYVEVLSEQDKPEDALTVLERATALYPDEPELIQARVAALAENERWLEASIAARQFALLNPDRPDVAQFEALADEHLDEFQSRTQSRLRRNAIANFVTGAASFVLTGNLFGPLSAVETTVLMLRGESAVGESITNQALRQLELVEDEAVVAYVNELGQRLANVAGRDEFEYEFYVVQDSSLNAFALPGGKVFVNAGAILEANSEAELAGLLAHELSHAVLSHGFQLVTSGNLTANLLQLVPYGGYAANLAVLSYSRDMERQADALGTRILATSGYAADGLHNLMLTLQAEEEEGLPFDWLSTHPDAEERLENMETQIELNGYSRYTYEGVERHQQMRQRVEQLLLEPDEAK